MGGRRLSDIRLPFIGRRLGDLFLGSRAIWVIAILLMAVSLCVIFSATSTKAFSTWNAGGHFFSFFRKHILYILISIVAMIGVSHIPMRFWRNQRVAFLILLGMVVLLFLVPIVGEEINGARRSFRIAGFSLQPSEFARLALINFTAVLLTQAKYYGSRVSFWWIAISTVLCCGIIIRDNISTAVLLGATIYILCFFGGAHKVLMRRTGLLALVGVVLAVGAILAMPDVTKDGSNEHGITKMLGKVGRASTGVARIQRFANQAFAPINEHTYSDLSGVDLQIVSAQRAIANSHLIGVGPGNSDLRNYLPEAYSDFVFAIIVEEYGIGGAFVVLLLYIVLFYVISRVAKFATTPHARLLALGIGVIILLQAIVHMLICVHLFPITGQNLPFISRGGSSYLATSVYFGILLRISEDRKIAERHMAAVATEDERIIPVRAERIPEGAEVRE